MTKKYLSTVATTYINSIVFNKDYSEDLTWILENSNQNKWAEKTHSILLKVSNILNHPELVINCGHFYPESSFSTKQAYVDFFKEKIEDILENTFTLNRIDSKEFFIKSKKDLIRIGINRCSHFQCRYCGYVNMTELQFNTTNNSVSFIGKPTCSKDEYVETQIKINKNLTITNIFNEIKDIKEDSFNINWSNEVKELIQKYAQHDIGYVQTGASGMDVYLNKQENKLFIVHKFPNKEARTRLKGFKKIGSITGPVWRVMFADLSNSSVKLQDDCEDYIDVSLKKGTYSVKTNLLGNSDIASEISLI